jgi:hypothetical protein
MVRTNNLGLRVGKKGKRSKHTPSGGRKKAKISSPDSCSTITNSQSAESSQDMLESAFSITTTTSSSSSRVTHGRDGVEFVENEKLDWRSFGRRTFQDWVENGWVEMVQEKISKYHKATSALRAQKVLMFQDELPLSFRGDRALSDRVHSVQQLLGELGRMYSAGESMNQVTAVTDRLSLGGRYSAIIVRQWALQFLRLGGKFTNVGYSKRTSRSVISDAVNRADMTT